MGKACNNEIFDEKSPERRSGLSSVYATWIFTGTLVEETYSPSSS